MTTQPTKADAGTGWRFAIAMVMLMLAASVLSGCLGAGAYMDPEAGPRPGDAASPTAAGNGAASGDAQTAGPPPNDNYADAIPIDALPFSDTRGMSEATLEPAELKPSCTGPPLPLPASVGPTGFGVDDASVWYRFEAITDTTITIDPRSSDFTVVVAVYDGEDLVTQQEVGCAQTDSSPVLTVDLAGGRSYAIQMARIYELQGTALSFTIVEGRVVLPPDAVFREDVSFDPGVGDATVIAIVDSGISPYHWDFLASRMPQALDANPANDLPLDQSPDTWLPGFPDPDTAFASYNRVALTLEEDDPSKTFADLQPVDAEEWNAVRPSTPDAVHYHWFPGTKVIGAITFSPDGRIEPFTSPERFSTPEHGHWTSGSAVGNFVGTCPECLLVFVQLEPADTGEQSNQQFASALYWAMDQPWIDFVSSSQLMYVDSPTPLIYEVFWPDQLPDWLESNLDMDRGRAAAERGQTLFQGAGNGIEGSFVLPNPTLTGSTLGPDWLVTVGGVGNGGQHISGAGKPADIAAPAVDYPVSNAAGGIGTHTMQSGTSLSAPAVAGIYAEGLYQARRSLPGPSRTQHDGIVATTDTSFVCGSIRPACELGDGVLTAGELRTHLFQGAIPISGETTVFGNGPRVPAEATAPIAEEWRLLNQGHGVYTGRFVPGGSAWLEDLERVVAPMEGRAATLERPEGERDWMIVDSFCRQHLWGEWDGGYFVAGETPLPGPDAEWPIRTGIETTCPFLPDRSATGDPGNEPQQVDDADPAVEYRGGWHRRDDAAASNGGYHRRMGSAGGGEAASARLAFEGQSITYFFGRSEQGGTAEVFLDDVSVAMVDYSGTAPGNNPEFGHSVTFDASGHGAHELLIVLRSGAVYVDGFEIAFDDGDGAPPSSGSADDPFTLKGMFGGAAPSLEYAPGPFGPGWEGAP